MWTLNNASSCAMLQGFNWIEFDLHAKKIKITVACWTFIVIQFVLQFQ